MTELDDEFIPLALEMCEEDGKEVTFQVLVGESYDPTATPKYTLGSVSNVSLYVTPPEGYEDRLIDGDLIRAGDKRIYLPASGLTFAPKTGQRVTIDSVNWTIIKAETIYSGGSVCLWELRLRT